MESKVGNQTFNAMISGRANMSVIVDGANVFSLNSAEGELVRQQPEALGHLFGGARDWDFVESESLEYIRRKHRLANEREQALDVVLILLDRSYSNKTRKEAAVDLANLLRDDEVLAALEAVMFSTPLPKGLDVSETLTFLKTAGGTVADNLTETTETWLRRLSQLQPTIRVVHDSFKIQTEQGIAPAELAEADAAFVRTGVFRDFVLGIHSGLSPKELADSKLNDPLLRMRLPDQRLTSIFRHWTPSLLKTFGESTGEKSSPSSTVRLFISYAKEDANKVNEYVRTQQSRHGGLDRPPASASGQ